MGQISPDGHWRWDGWRWVPAHPVTGQLSADAQWRWDGWQWVPARLAAVPQPPAARVPTIWTRRLQILLLAVAGFGFLTLLVGAGLLPSEWRSLQATLAAQWQAQGIPSSEVSRLEQSMYAILWVSIILVVLFGSAFFALQVAGTLRRWVWWYWVQFGLFCFAALGLLLTPLDLTSPVLRSSLVTLPLSITNGVLQVGAGICMLVAAVRIGPWAMTRDPHRLESRR